MHQESGFDTLFGDELELHFAGAETAPDVVVGFELETGEVVT